MERSRGKYGKEEGSREELRAVGSRGVGKYRGAE